MSFDELNLNTPLRNAIADLDFIQPTPIQVDCFSDITAGKDVVGIAQTGTGKTFAYLMPLLKNLPYSEKKHPRILILVPTRELVVQVVKEVEKLTKYMNVRYYGVYGGTNIKTQGKAVYKGLDVLVATPGRLIDLSVSGLLRLKEIKNVVVDEVDEMLNLGFRHQLINVFDMLPKRRQTLMFSATLSDDVEELINQFFYNPKIITTYTNEGVSQNIEQKAYFVPNFNTKINLLKLLLSDNDDFSKVLVFTASKRIADKVLQQIENDVQIPIGIIHSNKAQNSRLNSIRKFESGEIKVLIATDIAGRGLDFDKVTHVINFDTPTEKGDYVHRIGRTGRAGIEGKAITFVNNEEEEYLQQIEEYIKTHIIIEPLPENLQISEVLTEEEKANLYDKDYLPNVKIKHSQGAFHAKKEKNTKVNSGSPSRKRKRR